MYVLALYIGLSAAVLTYFSRCVVPAYAKAVHQGYEPDEGLWWQVVYKSGLAQRSDTVASILYGFCIGATLIYACFWLPWHAEQPLLNAFLISVWVGGLWLLALIDKSCWLLPDVLTQSLLWVGLVWVASFKPEGLEQAIVSAVFIYLIGRGINFLAFFYLKQPLIGMGDVKLLVVVTVWLGISAILPVFFMASIGCYAMSAWRQGHWRPRGYCAFGPYLVCSTFVVWYFQDYALAYDWA